MDLNAVNQNTYIEKLTGIVSRVTFHGTETGWSVLRVSPFGIPEDIITVTLHQAKVFAGATLEFEGNWTNHPKYGRQFKAIKCIEKKPASTAALEKYLGSGLIYGVGPKTAKKIVKYFKEVTLDIFENNINKLLEVPGIAEAKLKTIKESWEEHREIRNVMLFLQEHGISSLYAVKIFKLYQEEAISKVSENPYILSKDIYGIGFFSADKVALSLGLKEDGYKRISAAIKHILSSAREEGHCYLSQEQIEVQILNLININIKESGSDILEQMIEENEIKKRDLHLHTENEEMTCFYAKSLFFDEIYVAKKIKELSSKSVDLNENKIENWINQYCQHLDMALSDEQKFSVSQIVKYHFSILTGGPGCGKTTTTKVLVKLLQSMKKKITLVAPTGRAAQRMTEVIGLESKTIHRLLVWNPSNGRFKVNEDAPLETDFVIVDECSMLDINLTASLLKAIKDTTQVLFIGDPDQLPSVGAGNVLHDLIESKQIACFKLNQIFRQAQTSSIITYAHQINKGKVPQIETPFKSPLLWKEKDCLFIDSEEATQEQLKFIFKAKKLLEDVEGSENKKIIRQENKKESQYFKISKDQNDHFLINEEISYDKDQFDFSIPSKFKHVDLLRFASDQNEIEELKNVIKKVHPYSSLHYGLKATDMIKKLYQETIPKYLGSNSEVQILSPMTRGNLGTYNLNKQIQLTINPEGIEKKEIRLGERILREGDRIIQKRNNYDLGVFNGDIGTIKMINTLELQCLISFGKRDVLYQKESLSEIDLAYAITIHKSQGSEFDVVIIPILTQHFKMLFRNLIYTGLTRAKKMAIFVGTRKAFHLAIRNTDTKERQTTLKELIK